MLNLARFYKKLNIFNLIILTSILYNNVSLKFFNFFLINFFFHKFYKSNTFNLNLNKRKNLNNFVKLKAHSDLILFFFENNFTFYQNLKNVNPNNLHFLSNQYLFNKKKIKYNIFFYKYIFIQIQVFIEIIYYIFCKNKNIFIFSNPSLLNSSLILYYNIFGLKFINNLNFYLMSKFEWLKFKNWRIIFNDFLKKNNISLLIYLDYEYYNFSLTFLQNCLIPSFALLDLKLKTDLFDYYLLCDSSLKINHHLIILFIFKIYLVCVKLKKFNFFWFFYKNFVKSVK